MADTRGEELQKMCQKVQKAAKKEQKRSQKEQESSRNTAKKRRPMDVADLSLIWW